MYKRQDYKHGDPIYTSNTKGHGAPGVLSKLANSAQTNKQIKESIGQFGKSKNTPKFIDLGSFSFADMIGGTGKVGREDVSEKVKIQKGKLKEVDRTASQKNIPKMFENLPDGTEFGFNYIRDYLKPVSSQEEFIKSLKGGEGVPSSEEVAKGHRVCLLYTSDAADE